MRIEAEGIGVDAGIIIVCDIDYLKDLERQGYTIAWDEIKRLGKQFKVKSDLYSIGWHIEDTWNGPISGVTTIDITGEAIVVIDPCYCIGGDDHDQWMKWLDENFDRDNPSFPFTSNTTKAIILDEMGGDGCYKVELDLSTE